jgi:hypothetical protein
MCSNAGQARPPTRGEDDLATRLAAAIDELAATVRRRGSTDKDGAAHERAAQERAAQDGPAQDAAAQDHAAQDAVAQDHAEQDLAERLAHAWAMITAADPELAAQAARYARP